VDAGELQVELRALLVPYEDVLVARQLYGIEVPHRPGGRVHDWFAGVRPGTGTAKLMLLPGHPISFSGRIHERKGEMHMRIWTRPVLPPAITWLILALVLAACGNGGKPGY